MQFRADYGIHVQKKNYSFCISLIPTSTVIMCNDYDNPSTTIGSFVPELILNDSPDTAIDDTTNVQRSEQKQCHPFVVFREHERTKTRITEVDRIEMCKDHLANH